MSTMALEVAPFCTRVLAPFYLRVSSLMGQIVLSRLYLRLSFFYVGGKEGGHFGYS